MTPPVRVLSASIAVMACVAACSLTSLEGLTSPPSGDATSGSDSGAPPSVRVDAASADAGQDAAVDAALRDPYAAVVLADGPVAYFRFDEAADATSVGDDVGGLRVGLGSHAKLVADAVSGGALSFDGNGGLSLGDVFDFAGRVPFALELWVRAAPRADSDQHLVNKRVEGVDPMLGYVLYLAGDGSAHFEGWGVELTAWTDAPLPRTFTHVVLSVDYAGGKGNATLWIDGLEAPNGGYDNTDPLANTSASFTFGNGLRGELDELAIYDHPLSRARVEAHRAAGKR